MCGYVGRISQSNQGCISQCTDCYRQISCERHLEGIANYFFHQTTSGMMEGLNNRIKLILRQSYGFATFEMMREKLLACLFKEVEEDWEDSQFFSIGMEDIA